MTITMIKQSGNKQAGKNKIIIKQGMEELLDV